MNYEHVARRGMAAIMKKKRFPFQVTRAGESKTIDFQRHRNELTNGLG